MRTYSREPQGQGAVLGTSTRADAEGVVELRSRGEAVGKVIFWLLITYVQYEA